MVLTPRTCCWAGAATAAGRAVRPARTALAAAMKVRCWTRGVASWRAIGDRRVLEKVREAILRGDTQGADVREQGKEALMGEEKNWSLWKSGEEEREREAEERKNP